MEELPYRPSTDSLTGNHHDSHRWPWIFSQGEVWVDARLREHAIARMPEDYVANVIDFCHEFPPGFQRRLVEQVGGDDGLAGEQDPESWVEQTPLLRALRARLLALRLAASSLPRPRRTALEPAAAPAASPTILAL